MGFKVVPISYCSWEGESRKGINHFETIVEVSKREDFAEVFKEIECYIHSHVPLQHHNDAKHYYHLPTRSFRNEEITITPFPIHCKGESITNYIVVPNKLPGKMLNERLKAFGIKGAAISELVKKGKITVNGR